MTSDWQTDNRAAAISLPAELVVVYMYLSCLPRYHPRTWPPFPPYLPTYPERRRPLSLCPNLLRPTYLDLHHTYIQFAAQLFPLLLERFSLVLSSYLPSLAHLPSNLPPSTVESTSNPLPYQHQCLADSCARRSIVSVLAPPPLDVCAGRVHALRQQGGTSSHRRASLRRSAPCCRRYFYDELIS
jgi:hypothetical protein